MSYYTVYLTQPLAKLDAKMSASLAMFMSPAKHLLISLVIIKGVFYTVVVTSCWVSAYHPVLYKLLGQIKMIILLRLGKFDSSPAL